MIITHVSPSVPIKIYIAGDMASAKNYIRKFCMERGACFTLSPTDFIYTGGAESGMCIGLENYPRFPKLGEDLVEIARDLAEGLLDALYQKTAMVVSPDDTFWFERAQ
tara:strand:+ start:17112 stop:17435 length:324 start_codon:yes stop_codon:yes gene_type:complete